MSKPIIVWSDPPRKNYGRALKYAPYIELLKERPGHWACLQRSPEAKRIHRMRSTLANKRYQRLAHPYTLQLSARRTEDGDYGIWARVVEKK